MNRKSFIRLLSSHTDATPQNLLDVDNALHKVAAVPWIQVLITLLPYVIGIFTGVPIDFPALIAAILALLHPVAEVQ